MIVIALIGLPPTVRTVQCQIGDQEWGAGTSRLSGFPDPWPSSGIPLCAALSSVEIDESGRPRW
jgi:hypothetical protein